MSCFSLLLLTSVVMVLVNAELLFGDPYRNDAQSIVVNTIFETMTSIGQVAISYQGFAQVPSASMLPFRQLFSVQPASTQQFMLPNVYIVNSTHLAATITTTSGNETFIGPRIPLDAWFGFGIAIANNGDADSRHVLLYISYLDSTASMAVQHKLKGNMLPSSTAIALAPVLSPIADHVPAYIMSLHVINSALSQVEFDNYLWANPPSTYTWQIGNELGVFGFEQAAFRTNISCGQGGQMIGIRQAIYGQAIGLWPDIRPSSTSSCHLNETGTLATVEAACLYKSTCLIPRLINHLDPCPGITKSISIAITCSVSITGLWTWPASSRSTTSRPATKTPNTALSTLKPAPLIPLEMRSTPPFSTSALSTWQPSFKRTSNYNAWQVSLTIMFRTLGMSDTTQTALMSGFINDMSQALYVPSTRFTLVEFQQQTPSSTVLSFVVLPNATDSDATAVVSTFTQQMQIPGSDLRSGTLLVYAAGPPVAIQTIGLRVISCGGNLYVISPNTCPTISLASNANASINTAFMYLYIAGAILFILVIAGVCAGLYCWYHRKPIGLGFAQVASDGSAPFDAAAAVNNHFYPVHSSFLDVYQERQLPISPRAGNMHPMSSSVIVLPSLNDDVSPRPPPSPGRRKRSRSDKSHGARVHFNLHDAQIVHSEND